MVDGWRQDGLIGIAEGLRRGDGKLLRELWPAPRRGAQGAQAAIATACGFRPIVTV